MASCKSLNYNALTWQYHHPYGMMMPDRDWSSESEYRFGFGGKDYDAEIGENSVGISFDSRGYSPSLARWFNADNFAFTSPGHSPYSYAICNPVFFIDPSGDTILPFQRVRTFLGKKFRTGASVSTQNVEEVDMVLKNLRSNEVFCKVERQLQASTSLFQLIDTDITPKKAVDAQQKARGESETARGSFQPNHMGTRSDPYLIELNYKFNDLYGINGATLFEEVVHAGQHLFYTANPSYNPSKLDIEIEAKLIKALEGYTDDFDYPGFDEFKVAYKNGTATDEQYGDFKNYVYEKYVPYISDLYMDANEDSPTKVQDYGQNAFSGFLDYFDSIYESNPLLPEPVIIE